MGLGFDNKQPAEGNKLVEGKHAAAMNHIWLEMHQIIKESNCSCFFRIESHYCVVIICVLSCFMVEV